MMCKSKLLWFAVAVTLYLSPFTLPCLSAGAPTFIAKQGQIRVAGQPANGQKQMWFRLYTDPNADPNSVTPEWAMNNIGVYCINGSFNYPLRNGIDGLDFANTQYYMAMSVDGTNWMRPFEPIAAIPYAFAASTATCLRGNGHIRITGAGDHYILNGNVGIGGVTPFGNLHIFGDSNNPTEGRVTQLLISGRADASRNMYIGVNTGANSYGAIEFVDDVEHWGPLVLQQNGGNVGIGISNPGSKLVIEGGASGDQIRLSQGGTAYQYNIGRNTTSGFLEFSGTQTGYIGYVFSSGNVGIGVPNPSVPLEVNGRVKDKTGYMVPVGTVQMYAGSSLPAGWLWCNGASYSTSGTYADLFAAIGYTFGGSGGSFNVPNFMNLFPRGASGSTRTLGAVTYPALANGSTQNDKFQGHFHSKTENNHTHTVSLYQNCYGGAQPSGGSGTFADTWVNGSGPTAISLGQMWGTANGANTGLTVNGPSADGSNGTPRTGGTTEPQALGINFIIKY